MAKFTITFEGDIPEGMSGDQIVDYMQKAVPPGVNLLVKNIDTEKPGIVNLPKRKSAYDVDNTRYSWQ